MNKNILIRLSGWALILAGLRFFLITMVYTVDEGYTWLTYFNLVIVFLLGPLFVLFGLLGLRARYGDNMGRFARSALLVGAIADPLFIYGGAMINLGVPIYVTFFPAVALGQISLVIFGIASMKHKFLPRMQWLPVVAGILFPIGYPLHTFVLRRYFNFYSELSITPAEVIDGLFTAVFITQAIAIIALGWVVARNNRDSPSETNTIEKQVS
ncbi:MAG TPA: hypothetical protein VJ965_08740 [Anaerolineales bacterium]|nr:hypothetical protein [Anaerolineales bacterium]